MTNELAIPFRPLGEALASHAKIRGDKTAVFELDTGRWIDFRTLAQTVDSISGVLAARGIGHGDRVVVLSEECLEKLLVFLAVWRIGAIACPFHVEMSVEHLRGILGYLRPKLVLWHHTQDGETILGGLDLPDIRFGKWPNGNDPLFSPADAVPIASTNEPGDVACIFSTSGTTDRPKCVEWDHMGLWLCGLSSIDFTGLSAADRLLEYRTFSWLSPQILALMPLIQTGLSLYIARRFSHGRFFQWIADREITVSVGVPTVINMLLDRPVTLNPAAIRSLRLITSSSAPLAPDQWRRFEDVYGIRLLQFYGASEGGWLCGNRDTGRKIGTVGRPAKHMEFTILDPGGAPCPPGTVGEIAIRGRQTAVATFTPAGVYQDLRPHRLEVWMRTGDLGVFDTDGFVTVTGRAKDLIIRGGVNIAPLEIDAILMNHPKLADGAAVGVPDPIYGEEIAAFVVAKTGARLEIDEIFAHCAQSLPVFKTPKTVALIDALPRSDRGKIRRDALRDIWLSRVADKRKR